MVALFYIVYALQIFIISYLFLYNFLALVLFFVAIYKMKKYLDSEKLKNLDLLYHHPGLPGVSFLMPAYNEENAIIESIKSLMSLKYPRFEIIIINDGSTDATFRRVKNYFNFQKMIKQASLSSPGLTRGSIFDEDIDSRWSLPSVKTGGGNDVELGNLGCEPILGVYEIPQDLLKEHNPKGNILRVVLIDKKNGGKADSLNAGINIAQEPYVCSMDADSLMDPSALLIGMIPFLENPEYVIGVGGKVGIVNGCKVSKGQVVEVGLPKKAIELFQIIEYARSFNIGRTALAEMNSLVVLSGVFSIFRRDLVLKIGGYLTKNMKTDVGLRYCGKVDTVCEDMEIVVRLYRYIRENKIPGKVEYLPFPLSWTEAPAEYKNLGKQRSRWYRGLLESLWFHKKMIFNPFYGCTGIFAMPYQFLFEFLGPLIELVGYMTLPIFYFLGYLHPTYFFLFCLLAIVYGMFLSIMTLVLGIWVGLRYKTNYPNYNIFFATGIKNIFVLIFFSLLSNIGYKQYLLYWQAKGFVDFLKGKKSWEKFEHKGFTSS